MRHCTICNRTCYQNYNVKPYCDECNPSIIEARQKRSAKEPLGTDKKSAKNEDNDEEMEEFWQLWEMVVPLKTPSV